MVELKPSRRVIIRRPAKNSTLDDKEHAQPESTRSQILGRNIPDFILEDEALNTKIKDVLPENYNFEIHKIIHHILKNDARTVALQFPEGLLLFSCAIVDIINDFFNIQNNVDVDLGAEEYLSLSILGDVTYGACCIDDYFCHYHDIDLLVHFGHSCLIPVSQTLVKIIYIFVDIKIDLAHFIDTVKYNFYTAYTDLKAILPKKQPTNLSPLSDQEDEPELTVRHLIFVSTVQFSNSLQIAAAAILDLNAQFEKDAIPFRFRITIPKVRPLSPGELLGCTSPVLYDHTQPGLNNKPDAIVYLGDGRFHMESILIQNPELDAFMYNPYTKRLTKEFYDHDRMHTERQACISSVKAMLCSPPKNSGSETTTSIIRLGVILGTLGRQGSKTVFDGLLTKIELYNEAARQKGLGLQIEIVEILISEIFPAKLELFGPSISAFVQVACPRLSIDWGPHFPKPLLTPYEFNVVIDQVRYQQIYPMDFYAHDSLGDWTPNHRKRVILKQQ